MASLSYDVVSRTITGKWAFSGINISAFRSFVSLKISTIRVTFAVKVDIFSD